MKTREETIEILSKVCGKILEEKEIIFSRENVNHKGQHSMLVSPCMFSKLIVKCIDASGYDLTNADLSNLDLKYTFFVDSNLNGVNFAGSDLLAANFSGADIMNTNFKGCNLDYVEFYGANIRGADFRKANVNNTLLEAVKI